MYVRACVRVCVCVCASVIGGCVPYLVVKSPHNLSDQGEALRPHKLVLQDKPTQQLLTQHPVRV